MNSNVIMIPAKKADVPEQKLRTAAYCRVSSDSTDQLNSYIAQVRYYEKFLSESDTAILVNVYADEGITGTRMDKRDEFLRMLRDCRKGKIDRIITKSVSRFARNTKECLSVIRELKELGITIMFEKEGIDTANISDEMMITIMGGLAQEESVSISQNMKWSGRKRMAEGKYKIACPPYGFNIINGEWSVNESEAVVVRQIFSLYLNGYGLEKISKMLNSNNIKSSMKEEKWHPTSVRYILKNERYIGDAIFQKSYRTDTLPYVKKENNGLLPKYHISSANTPIISKSDFEKVQNLLTLHSIQVKRNEYPLSKKIFCGNCGGIYKRVKSNQKHYWVCIRHNRSAENCYSKPIGEELIYETFICLYNNLKYQYSNIFTPMLSQLQELNNKKHIGNQQYMDVQKETAKLKEQLHVLARLKTKGFIDDEKYITQSTGLSAKIEKLNTELRKLSQADDEDEVIDQISEIAAIIENGTELMTEFDEVMFESLVEKIIVMDQNTLEFHLHGGLRFTEKIN